jgi:uncharacterized membrane protein
MNDSSDSTTKGVDDTADSIAVIEKRAHEDRSLHQRWIERVTSTVGQPGTVYVLIVFIVGWIAVNLALHAAGRAFDPPPFSWLQGIVSLSALFMTIFILTTGNRISQHDVRRDQLDLQINIMTERKISKVIEMLEAMRADTPGIPNRHDPEATEMRNAIDPHDVVRKIDERATS